MRKEHAIGAAVGAAALDIGRAIVVDEAESLILKFLAWLWEQVKALFTAN
jgi:hypothetical protein